MQQTMSALDFDVEGLSMDVFELVDSGLDVESLTSGHGVAELGASCSVYTCCSWGSDCSGCCGSGCSCGNGCDRPT